MYRFTTNFKKTSRYDALLSSVGSRVEARMTIGFDFASIDGPMRNCTYKKSAFRMKLIFILVGRRSLGGSVLAY